jgi:transposase-like protein
MSTEPFDLNEEAREQILGKLQQEGLQGFLQEMIEFLCNEVMEMERTAFLNADPHERTDDRNGYRNGYKQRELKTTVGPLTLRVPQDREGNFHPSLFAKYQRSEKALVLALQEMYLNGVSTRKTKKITEKLCGTQFSKDQVSRFAQKLDKKVQAWRNRQLDKQYPYLVIDARYEKVRQQGPVEEMGVLIVKGVREDGKREILAVDVAVTENKTTWSELFKDLKDRGLSGVRYVVSDAHEGLQKAVSRHFQGAIWQRCQEHYIRNAEDKVRKRDKDKVRARLQDAFHAPSIDKAKKRLEEVIEKIKENYPDVAEWLARTGHEPLQVFALPAGHRKRMRTNNSLERFMEEIKRRTKVIRMFPNKQSCLRLVSALCMEQSEDWVTGYRYLDMSLLEEDEPDEKGEEKSYWKENAKALSATFTEKT